MKIRVVILILLAGVLSTSSMAQQAGNDKSLLWRISGNGLAKPSYLFGAIDYICPGDYLWTSSMQDCFAKSEQICLQVNIAEAGIKARAALAMKDASGKKISDYFTPSEYALVTQYVKDSLHTELFSLKTMQSYQPVVVQPLIIKKLLGCDDPVAYSIRIAEAAKKSGKKITGLETLEDEMNVIKETHFNDKIAATLVAMANGDNYFHDYRSKMMSAYQHQDIQSINTLFKSARGFSHQDLNVFLSENDSRWLAAMQPLMKHGSVFFALNPLNFSGDDGLISLLRKAGYTVEPVF